MHKVKFKKNIFFGEIYETSDVKSSYLHIGTENIVPFCNRKGRK